LKNEFGALLEKATHGGVVAITRHRAPIAVLLSYEEFESLAQLRSHTLEILALSSTTSWNACRLRKPKRRWRPRSTPRQPNSDMLR
jgi:prevent-host-death family protein